MDISNTPQVSVIPDQNEKRAIRLRYNMVALILIINTLIFNVGARLTKIVLEASFGEAIWDNELIGVLYSCGFPIVSEVISIILGISLLKLDFKPLFTRNGYTGGTVAKLATLSLGLQTAASFIATIISTILGFFGLEGKTADLSATTSLPANLIMYFYACLLGPVLEELLYRGVILQSMRKYNERFAIFLSAAVFGLMHQNYQQAILGFLVGIPLAIVTIKSGSIIPAIFTHIILNTLATVTSCWIQYAAPDLFNSISSGDLTAAAELLTGKALLPVMVNFILRMGFMLAALVVGIIALVKGHNMRRPTPAGKARTMPVFVTAACWWIVFAFYAYLNLIDPFI
ncbi:MAG: CPBP family intramembrane metalloprotease [Oscillospiraceae bacterium]|nr:CPBP family intramembrane metalloprotease [Oscillospiraceae bacterium]